MRFKYCKRKRGDHEYRAGGRRKLSQEIARATAAEYGLRAARAKSRADAGPFTLLEKYYQHDSQTDNYMNYHKKRNHYTLYLLIINEGGKGVRL